jgi:hypothetical protein
MPIFYTFAHCVGSESLSLILVLVFAAVGLRIMRAPGAVSLGLFYSLALVLYLAMLTRYVNLLLAFVLPLALLACGRKHFSIAVITFAIGLICIAMAQRSTAEIAHWGKITYHPRPGFTFLWRLGFIAKLPEPERARIFDRVNQRVRTEDARKLVAFMREALHDEERAQPLALYHGVAAALFPPESTVNAADRIRRCDEAMNEVARGFLAPPTLPHWRAAWDDFTVARRWPCGEIVRYLFETTAYILPRLDEMPELARLTTFRSFTSETLAAITQQNAYFHFWRGVSLNNCLGITSSALVITLLRRRRLSVFGYAAALAITGAVMVFITCLMGAMIQRYTLPLWELALLAFLISLGEYANTSDR